MAETASALAVAEARAHGVTLRDAGPQGMVTLRGDLSAEGLRAVVAEVAGAEVPQAGRATLAGEAAVLWMSPDELLLVLPAGQAGAAVARLTEALAGTHHLALDVSDARAAITLEGAGLREVLAKLAPVDMAPGAFGPGMFRRTRLGQVAAAFWMESETQARVICFRSVSEYVFGLLKASAAGGPVGHY